jgi:hypothetical protein
MHIRKKLLAVEYSLNDAVDAGLLHEKQTWFIDVNNKTKIDDLKTKLPMLFQAAMKDWEQAGAKITNSKRALREHDCSSTMNLAAEIAG